MKLKYMITSAVFAALFLCAKAQTIGKVGSKNIDGVLMNNITQVYPFLANTTDTAQIRKYVYKYYAQQLVMADSVRKMPAYDSLKKVLDEMYIVLEAKVLGQYYQGEVLEKQALPTEKEIQDYYEANKSRFMTVPVYSFFQAWTAAGDKNTVAEIKGEMARMYKQPPTSYGTSKKTGSNYTLNFENKLQMLPAYDMYEALKTSKPGEVSGPYTVKNRTEKLYLLVTYAEPEKIKPLAEVREDVINQLRLLKRDAIEKGIKAKAEQQYPIKFNGQ